MIPEVAAYLGTLYPGQAPRQLIERHDAISALQALGWHGGGREVSPDLRWLWNGGKMRMSILAELGRIEEPGAVLTIARQICELKPKAREAVAMIRRCRLGESPLKDGGLTAELIRAVNAYLTRHPSMSWDDVWEEVTRLRERIKESVRLEAAS
jgi:hypothetical protein